MGKHYELRSLAENYRPEMVPPHMNWPVLASGIIMLAFLLVGLYVIFIYWRRQSRLNVEQKTFISQITHELKSPLASIQLHLETIRLRNPPPDKLERFLDTMLADTERLNNLISNFLMAAKLEQRQGGHLPAIDFSAFVEKCLEQQKNQFLTGINIFADIEQEITVATETEGMEMVIRNLLENAVLYSPASPEVRVTLKAAGKACHLSFQDNGRGLDKKEFGNIFRMFYRVRQSGENIKGTGLGLYIVKSVVKRHNGKTVVTSQGIGKGCTFTITLPTVKQATQKPPVEGV